MIKLHIFLSTLAVIIMIVAGIQAIAIALQDHLLRYPQSSLMKYLPPIETMEKWLFRSLTLGFFVLSIVLVTSIIAFHPVLSPPVQQKFLLTLIAWIVFASLLIGRFYRGWRGRVAIRWTLAGVLLILIIYYGTGILLHAVN